MDSPQKSDVQLSVHVDFNNLRGKLGSAVDRCIRLASIGFQSAQQPINEELRMPGSGWRMSFSGAPPWSDSEAREQYTGWLFATALRDVLEAFGTFLDECYDIASFIRLRQRRDGLLGQDLFNHQTDVRKYRRYGIDKKIEKLKPWFGMLPEDLQEDLKSINCARNILTHHEGIVPATYVEGDGRFRISWTRLTLTAVGPQEREIRLGEVLKAGEGLGLRTVLEHRDFSEGNRLDFTPTEFSGICWTVFIAGDAIREALEREWFSL